MQKPRTPEIIAGRVNPDGSIAAGDGFTVQKTGAGTYAVTLPLGFRLTAVTLTAYNGASLINTFNTLPGERTFSVATFSLGGANGDAYWGFLAAGVQQ